MKRITITNQKGGVGKTTLAVNLARFLSKPTKKKRKQITPKGLKVLFFDLDMQKNSSFSLQEYSSHITTSDFFNRKLNDEEIASISFLDNISLIASTNELANNLNVQDCVSNFEYNIKKLDGKYDVIIMDTPPTLTEISAVALFISEGILIPIEAESFSLMGAKSLLTTIDNVKQYNNKIEILGLIVNRFDSRGSRKIEILDELKLTFKDKLLKSIIVKRDSIAEAMALATDIRKLKKTAAKKAILEIDSLCKEIKTLLKKD